MTDKSFNTGPYTDLSYLRESSSNNEEFVREMVRIFLRQTPEFLNALEAHLATRNILEFRQVLHKLKPTIAFMGIATLEGTVKSMEKAAKETNDMAELDTGLKHIKAICALAYQELVKVLE